MSLEGSFLGCPAVTVPLLEDGGLPLGLQPLGGTDRDAALFAVASWVAARAFANPALTGARPPRSVTPTQL